MKSPLPIIIVAIVMIAGLAWFAFEWTVNRIYVPEGHSLQLRYKGPLIFGPRQYAKAGHWAEKDKEIGVQARLRGPGRHFYNPIYFERTLISDVVIRPGQVGVVTCSLGDELPDGEFLVDGDIGTTTQKGILRKVLHPGRYRINTYGYKVEVVDTIKNGTKQAGWVKIPTGFVGVVTNMAKRRDEQGKEVGTGVQDDVLPPGIYPINGREQQVDVVEIGFRHTTIRATQLTDAATGKVKVDEAGEPLIANDHQGIEFPSSDGFNIHMDFTAIWGILPEQAPHAIRTIGDVNMVEQKIVLPQVESICRNNGSRYKAVELLVGTDREKFQQANITQFHDVLDEKQITLLFGLVRHIYIPQEVRKPIQTAFIADELTLTRTTEKETARAEAEFRDSERKVDLASRTVEVETEKMVATKKAEMGDRESARIRAETDRLVANIQKETAELEAQAVEILGKAENEGKQMVEEAKAGKFALAVEAFGSPEAYSNWVFAEGLPQDIDLKFMYAGPGTLWTDLSKAADFGVRANIAVDNKPSATPAPPAPKPAPAPPVVAPKPSGAKR